MLPEGARTRVERIETFDGPLEVAARRWRSGRARRPARRRPRRGGRRRREDPPAAARAAGGDGLLDGRAAAAGRRPLPAQAHHAPRAGDGRARRLARGRRKLRSAAGRPSSSSTTSGDARCGPSEPVFADPYERNRSTGAFILIDERTHDTVGAGLVRVPAREGARASAEQSRDILWHPSHLDRGERWDTLGQRGRDGVADRPARVGQVDDRDRAGAGARRARPRRLPARRRQHPPRAVRRPRLRRGLAGGEHPPRRPRRPAVRRRRGGRRRVARSRRWPRPRARARGCTRWRAAVHRGVRRHAGRGVRAARPEGPVRPGPRGAAEHDDRERQRYEAPESPR